MVAFNGRDLKVLVAEDNEHFRLLVRTVLKALGIRHVEEATDGAGAFERLRAFPADLVIADWKMAPMNGLDFARAVRLDAGSPNPFLPMIMISGYADARLMADARDAGINEFMAKPISARMLMARVVVVLQRPKAFVRAGGYFGPDRRRRPMVHWGSERRLKQEAFITPEFSTDMVS